MTHCVSSVGSTGCHLGCWFGRAVAQQGRDLLLFSALSDLTVGLVKNLVHLQEAFLALITRLGADRCILSWYFNVFTLWWVVFQHFEAQILR